jgi:hypothetical protein
MTPDRGFGSTRRHDTALLGAPDQLHERLAVGAAAVAVTLLFWFAAGLAGVGTALLALLVWYILGTPYALGTATVLVAPTVAGRPVAFVALTAGLLVLTLVTIGLSPEPVRSTVFSTAVAGVFGICTWGLLAAGSLWVGAVGLVLVVGVASALLARYHLLVLGVVDAANESLIRAEAGHTDSSGDG